MCELVTVGMVVALAGLRARATPRLEIIFASAIRSRATSCCEAQQPDTGVLMAPQWSSWTGLSNGRPGALALRQEEPCLDFGRLS